MGGYSSRQRFSQADRFACGSGGIDMPLDGMGMEAESDGTGDGENPGGHRVFKRGPQLGSCTGMRFAPRA